MLSFVNDYSQGAHPQVIEALGRLSSETHPGYGEDRYSKKLEDWVRQNALAPQAQVHVTAGGTQANRLVISSLLRPFEAVIAADSGHINVHETGAIESSGHKVLTWPHENGKLTADGIREILWQHSTEHMVRPRMVYISDTTEWGSVYTKKELEEISGVCRSNGLALYLDGARLGSALSCRENDMTLADLAALTDAFTIGGTKNGALFGEAIVLCRPDLFPDFRFMQKQQGALLAKGFACSAQFTALLEGGLYWELGERANQMAGRLASVFAQAGISFYLPPTSNQIFPILPGPLSDALSDKAEFMLQMPVRGGVVARFVTSWATKAAQIEELDTVLWELLHGNGDSVRM